MKRLVVVNLWSMLAAAALLACFIGAAKKAEVDLSKIPPAAERKVDFATDVRPIFAGRCYNCHGPEKQKSDYRLDERERALRGGSIGAAIVAGDGVHSAMIQYVSGAHEEIRMPPKGEALTVEQVRVLRAWIDQGAVWPDSLAVA